MVRRECRAPRRLLRGRDRPAGRARAATLAALRDRDQHRRRLLRRLDLQRRGLPARVRGHLDDDPRLDEPDPAARLRRAGDRRAAGGAAPHHRRWPRTAADAAALGAAGHLGRERRAVVGDLVGARAPGRLLGGAEPERALRLVRGAHPPRRRLVRCLRHGRGPELPGHQRRRTDGSAARGRSLGAHRVRPHAGRDDVRTLRSAGGRRHRRRDQPLPRAALAAGAWRPLR